jgi:hypothetical protein
MSATFNKFNIFPADLANGVHKMGSDTLKVMFTNTAPSAANAVLADITEIAAGNGYTAGGNAASLVSSSQTSGVYKLVLNNPATWTAAGGSIGPFRYAVLYNATQTSPLKPLIAWYDYGTAATLNSGEQFQVAFDATNGVFSLA